MAASKAAILESAKQVHNVPDWGQGLAARPWVFPGADRYSLFLEHIPCPKVLGRAKEQVRARRNQSANINIRCECRDRTIRRASSRPQALPAKRWWPAALPLC